MERFLYLLSTPSFGAIHNLDFRIRILDLRTDWPATQLDSDIFNPQSEIKIPKSICWLLRRHFL